MRPTPPAASGRRRSFQLNPSFEAGGHIDDLVSGGTLNAECAKIFRLKNKDDTFGKRLILHRPCRYNYKALLIIEIEIMTWLLSHHYTPLSERESSGP